MKKLSLTLFLALICSIGFAQKSKLDSTIYLFDQSRTKTGVDTAKFTLALNKMYSLEMTDVSTKQLEKAASKFNKGNNEDLSFAIIKIIFDKLVDSKAYNKAFEYGKLNYELLEKSKTPNADILKYQFLINFRVYFRSSGKLQEGLTFFNQQLNTFKAKNDINGLANCHFVLAAFYDYLGLYNQEIYHFKKSISYLNLSPSNVKTFLGSQNRNTALGSLNSINLLSSVYILEKDFPNALYYAHLVIKRLKNIKVTSENKLSYLNRHVAAYSRIAEAKMLSNQLDSVEYYLNKSDKIAHETNYHSILTRNVQIRGLLKKKLGKLDEAELLLKACEDSLIKYNSKALTTTGIVTPSYVLAEIKIEQKKYNDAITFLNKNLALVEADKLRLDQLKTYRKLAEVYETIGNHEKSVVAYQKFTSIQDSLLADQRKYSSVSFELEQQMNENELSISKLQSDNKISALTRNFSFAIAALLSLLAVGLYFRFKSKQKANAILQGKNEEIQSTLSKLKSTQNQLIQSEKLASLGELTAGIAHEIQNPLNFVNNFSELSVDLAKELKEEIKKPEKDWELIDDLTNDLTENQEKINHHGKRASSIVKGMLEHSRISTGVKELTDINALADEYLRLAYHGLRAKDKDFNVTLETHFDENLPKVLVIPQDFGRVLLNLFNNAFYAVTSATSTSLSNRRDHLEAYKPTVTVNTRWLSEAAGVPAEAIEVRVKDNGTGMSEATKVKIFQPFFTTKPTGQGTGLGLSLAYDIVTKGHGGTIECESVEGEGTTFIVKLPV